ncbi:hypothetical protein CEUSTIGMA_g12113.t1 [Chlamydomonas eustigma]|uniref:Sucrose phosphatase-like domain-containing protein n=1 Tax=Chlamydomonas eustigma TaxID=1157962 RepID=A0A250XNM2_9CHLO|nr:hypothetical protein CEUSTIGMA_g12113.t1 [Chlamydomonas eustigma]|eukprot:GAX84691.1 hypothetical protein CEUSTIGMA_g12113.t1 [Chlamydomonas eustigma]
MSSTSMQADLLNPNKPPLHQDWLHLPSLTALQGTDTAHSLPAKQYNEHAAWLEHLDGDGWDREKVLRAASSIPELVLQGSSEQRPHKVSFYLVPLSNGQGDQMSGAEPVLQQLSTALDEIGLSAKVIFSGGVDVDVVPERAGKGNALRFLLREKFGPYYNKGHALWPPLGVQVNGDSGNDEELFEVEHVHGCIVANAKAELLRYAEAHSHEPRIYKASLPCAAGILEAMQHFGVIESSAGPNHDGVETGHLCITASPSKHIQVAAVGACCYQPAAGGSGSSSSSSMPHTITPALACNIGHSAVALGDFLAAHDGAIADLRQTAQEQNFNELGRLMP